MRLDTRVLIIMILALIPILFAADTSTSATRRVVSASLTDRISASDSSTLRPAASADHSYPFPFADNPDPTQCGIPTAWVGDNAAWISGIWQNELIAPVIDLYDSHLRAEITGQIPHGSQIEIELSQANPVLNYYFVRSVGLDSVQQGWVPGPFVSFQSP